METKPKTNTCMISYQRELSRNSVSSHKLISDRLNRKTELLYQRDLLSHFGCVNAIEFSNNGLFLVSGGDDRRVLLWNVQKALHNCGKPTIMRSEHHSNIFCLSFDNSVKHIYSAGNDNQVILHDIQTGKALDVFNLEHPVYGISVDPCNDNIFASAGEDGRILVFDTRLDTNGGHEPYQLASYLTPFHSVMFNPVDTRLITTANSEEGAALWDIRNPNKVLLQYGRKGSCMNVRWDQTGTRILALRRRQTPVLYEYSQPKHIVQFFHEDYYNSCTMKSCCFAGLKDEYVLSGSDDFNLYMWKIEDAMNSADKTSNVHQILKGHRSIVNQVRFDRYNCIIASSGVEKLIKVWSPMPLPFGSSESNSRTRRRYTHDEYISLLLRSGQFMSHDYSEQSIAEDPQMMAFFDSLVQRERDGIATDSDDTSDDDLICTGNESLDDTDYSSLSDDSSVPNQNSTRRTSSERSNGNTRSRFRLSASVISNNARENDDDGLGMWRSRFRRSIFENQHNSTSSSASQSQNISSSSSTSISSSSSASSSSSSSSSSLSSSNSEEDKRNRTPKRKSKSKVKDALQRLKRVRSAAIQSSTSADSPSDRSTLETCPSSGGTSTDTLDSGVCMNSSPTPPRIKFTSFKRNEKRKYRPRRSPSSSSVSSNSD